jgi:4-amino-4-deoxychorismate lyase
MTVRIYRGQQRVDVIDPRDRGLAYGDGLFETILVHRGNSVWRDVHLERLRRGCEALGIAMPDRGFLQAQCDELIAGCVRGVLKIVVTRGVGERGYAIPANAEPTLLLSLGDAPHASPRDGLALRWCDTRLSIQPRLAGIKHLNRLEQVLARAEWDDASIHEGLLCDTRGRVVGATSANLFILRGGRWLTPPVADCGIAGSCRAWLLKNIATSAEAELDRAGVESADALVLCNSVRGILPVAALGGRRWASDPRAAALREALAAAEPGFHSSEVA